MDLPKVPGGAEIFIGVVSPMGCNLDRLTDVLSSNLNIAGYTTEVIHLAEELRVFPDLISEESFKKVDQRYHSLIKAGTELRRRSENNDAMALLGVGKVLDLREERDNPERKTAYIFRSLKHEAEVKTLRCIYGCSFKLFAVHSATARRLESLTERIALSHSRQIAGEHQRIASELLELDENEGTTWGQRVTKTYHLADFFVDLDLPDSILEKNVRRYIELMFGNPFHTPTRPEYCMFHAYGASLRSAALGRQVGAALANHDAQILALGTNEVPKSGGGHYWPEEEQLDKRDFQLGHETNDVRKRLIFEDLVARLYEAGWLKTDNEQKDLHDVLESMDQEKITKGALYHDIIEFFRCVHAEMSALSDAARRGISVEDADLFVTTFPCHECTRHIICSGIRRVHFIEPYPKSLALELHSDAIKFDGRGEGACEFRPFVGVSPQVYMEMFALKSSRKEHGAAVKWSLAGQSPSNHCSPIHYLNEEITYFEGFIKSLEKQGLIGNISTEDRYERNKLASKNRKKEPKRIREAYPRAKTNRAQKNRRTKKRRKLHLQRDQETDLG